MKTQSQSSLLSSLRSGRGEKILEVDGTLTTQPVLEHVGISAWPGGFLFSQYWLPSVFTNKCIGGLVIEQLLLLVFLFICLTLLFS